MNTATKPYALLSYAGVYIMKWNDELGRFEVVSTGWDLEEGARMVKALNRDYVRQQLEREVFSE